MKYNLNYQFIICFSIFLNVSSISFAQQTYDSALPAFKEFCNASILENENVKDFSNITTWVNENLNNFFFGLSRNSISSRNSSGFIQLSVYDDGKGINLPLYDDLIVFSPTAITKRKINEKLTRNKYWFSTGCNLDILNYCNSDYVKSFDYTQRSYFEIGTYIQKLSLKNVIANTINEFVTRDEVHKKTSIQVFIQQINKKMKTAIEIPDDENNEFQNVYEALTAKYSYEEVLNIIFETYIKKNLHEDTEDALNAFYRRLMRSSNYSAEVNKYMHYNLNIGFKKEGFIKISKDIMELVDPETNKVIESTEEYVKIPTYKVDVAFAVDNTPRLKMTFAIQNKENLRYKINAGYTSKYVKRLEKVRITKENPEYLNFDELEVIFYNDRIQISISSSTEYHSYQIINEKRNSLLPQK